MNNSPRAASYRRIATLAGGTDGASRESLRVLAARLEELVSRFRLAQADKNLGTEAGGN